MCVLLWRILAIQPEVQDGRLRLLKQSFFRLWKEGEGDFTELSDRLTSNVAELVQKSGRHHLPNFMSFIMRVRLSRSSVKLGKVYFVVADSSISYIFKRQGPPRFDDPSQKGHP